MKRWALGILAVAAAMDLAGNPHSHILIDQLLDILAGVGFALKSALFTKMERWGVFLAAIMAIGYALSTRRPDGRDIIG